MPHVLWCLFHIAMSWGSVFQKRVPWNPVIKTIPFCCYSNSHGKELGWTDSPFLDKPKYHIQSSYIPTAIRVVLISIFYRHHIPLLFVKSKDSDATSLAFLDSSQFFCSQIGGDNYRAFFVSISSVAVMIGAGSLVSRAVGGLWCLMMVRYKAGSPRMRWLASGNST